MGFECPRILLEAGGAPRSEGFKRGLMNGCRSRTDAESSVVLLCSANLTLVVASLTCKDLLSIQVSFFVMDLMTVSIQSLCTSSPLLNPERQGMSGRRCTLLMQQAKTPYFTFRLLSSIRISSVRVSVRLSLEIVHPRQRCFRAGLAMEARTDAPLPASTWQAGQAQGWAVDRRQPV